MITIWSICSEKSMAESIPTGKKAIRIIVNTGVCRRSCI